MRRSDREVRERERIREILEGNDVIRIGFYDPKEKEVYIVPVNYGYEWKEDELVFYFHGASSGRKAELSLSSPEVGFEIDRENEFVENEIACRNSVTYQSIIGNGSIEILKDPSEKLHGLMILMKHITKKEDWQFDERMVQAVAVYRLAVTKYSAKEKVLAKGKA